MARGRRLSNQLWVSQGAGIPQEPIVIKLKGTKGHRLWIKPYGAKVLLDHPKEEKVLELLGAKVDCACFAIRKELNRVETFLRSGAYRSTAITYKELDEKGIARSEVTKLEPLLVAWKADADTARLVAACTLKEVRRTPRLKLNVSPLAPVTSTRVQQVQKARAERRTYGLKEEWVKLFFPSLPPWREAYGKRLLTRMERIVGLLSYLLPRVAVERDEANRERLRFSYRNVSEADRAEPIFTLSGGWGNFLERLNWGLILFERFVILEHQWQGERDPKTGRRLALVVVAETTTPARVMRGWRMLLACEQGKTPQIRAKEPWKLPGLDAFGVDLATAKLLTTSAEVEAALDRVP